MDTPRKLLATLVWLSLLSNPTCAAEDVVAPEGYELVGEDKAAAVQRLCQATADTGLFSGAVLVAEKGEIIFKSGFGLANREWNIPNTTDTKFRLASVSKQFCTLVIMQLVEEGVLSLDDSIRDHLRYYREDTGEKITIHHLMAHQSGLRDYTASYSYRGEISRRSFDPDEFIKLYCSSDLEHEPGTIYSYCNAGYSILGRIIEKVTRKSFEQNLKERIFVPLGMKNSGFDSNETILSKRASGYTRGSFGFTNAEYIEMGTTPGAAGALYSTVEDMFLWDRALYTDQLLSEDSRHLMFTPNHGVPEVKAAGGRPHSRYGYGWQIFTRTHPETGARTKVVNHGGAINGFRAMEHRLVDDDAFIIVLCNQGDTFGDSQVWNAVVNLSHELIHIVTGQPFRLSTKPGLSQDQRLYNMIKEQGVERGIEWFLEKGKKAPWGGTNMKLAEKLIEEGETEAGLRLMELEVELGSGKVWLLRKAAELQLWYGEAERALELAEAGLQQKPEDDRLIDIKQSASFELSCDE